MEEIGQVGTSSHAAILHAYLWAYFLSEKPDYKNRLMEAVDALLLGSDRLPAMEHGHPGRRRQALRVDSFMTTPKPWRPCTTQCSPS